jgi:DNA-binding transcriptional LysR family regulator
MPKDFDGVTLEQLRTLRAVAKERSFSAAARRTGKVQSAVSQSMERLERELGLRLFDRSGKSIRLTHAGTALAAAADRVCTEAQALGDLTESLRAGAETKLTIVVDSIVPSAALVDFAREFQAAHPHVELTVLTETMSAVTQLVRTKKAAFGIAGPVADFAGLERLSVGEVRMIPICGRDHPLATRGARWSESDLRGQVQIVLSERGLLGEQASADQGVISPRTWRVVDLATKHALLRGGLGWGNMPEHMVRADLRTGDLVALQIAAWGPDAHRLDLSLVRRSGAVDGPVARSARERLSSLCGAELRDVVSQVTPVAARVRKA